MDFTGGLFCLVFFSVYIFAVGLAIWEGYLTLSVEDRDPEDEVEEEVQVNDEVLIPELLLPIEDETEREQLEPPPPELRIRVYPSRLELRPSICTPLLGNSPASTPWLALSRIGSVLMPHALLSPAARLSPPPTPQRRATSPLTRNLSFRILQSATNVSAVPGANFQTVGYHLVRVGIGFLAVAVSGFVISYVAASLADRFKISGTVFGMTILSIVLTIPEKLILVIVGIEGNSSILVASIAGSNVFHLTLCLGILFVAGGEGDADAILAANMLPFEVWVTWGCSILLLLVVWFGGRRWMGAILFLLYLAFNAIELTVYRR
jgi:Ca2+/Na+ antiporter